MRAVTDSMRAAHVIMRSVLDFDEEDSQIRFDEAARRLVLVKHRCFIALPLNQALLPITVESRGKVENVRLSLNHRFAAVQRSDVELEFMDLLQGTSFTHTCKGGSKGRWRMLSFHWTGSPVADFVVVTTAGVEFYLVMPERACLKIVKYIAHQVAWSVYSHMTRLVLLATGPQDNLMHGIQIQPVSLVRIPKFEIALAPPVGTSLPLNGTSGQGRLRRSLLPGNLSVARLYDMIFCVHCETEKRQVHLYQLFKDFVVRKYVLSVYSCAAAVSVSDNLLIVHALDAKVALIFDLKINVQFPITAPLPIATMPGAGFSPLYSPHWSLAPPDYVIDPQAGRVGQMLLDLHTIARSSIDKACLLQFLLARERSILRRKPHRPLVLPMTASLPPQPAGTYCSEVIIEVFAKSLLEQEVPPILARMFDLLHAAVARSLLSHCAFCTATAASSVSGCVGASANATLVAAAAAAALEPPSTSCTTRQTDAPAPSPRGVALMDEAGNLQLMNEPAEEAAAAATDLGSGGPLPSAGERPPAAAQEQREGPPDSAVFVSRVFGAAVKLLPSLANAQEPRRQYLVTALTEYLHSQQQHALPLDVSAGTLLLTLLEEQGSYYQVHQLVQYHLVPDSTSLAARLLRLEPMHPPAAELALDMLKRLGPLGADGLMNCLLERGQSLAACRFIRSQRLLTYPPRPLFAAAAAKSDVPTFAALCTFFRQRNEVWRGSAAFLPEEECDKCLQKWATFIEGCRADEENGTWTPPGQ